MTGIKYSSLEDLNNQAIKWNIKVNGKIHSTTGKIPHEILAEENLSPMTREYIIDKMNVRKVEKDCLISYGGNKYSVPSEYSRKYVTVVALDNVLSVYYQGKQIALHQISYNKYTMSVNREHYRNLVIKQTFDTENTLFATKPDYSEDYEINMGVYDL